MTNTLEDAYKLHGQDTHGRYSNGLVYSSLTKQWEYLTEIGPRYAAFSFLNANGRFDSHSELKSMYKHYLVIHPHTGYYNHPTHKMGYLFTRWPIRGIKKTSTIGRNCSFTAPFWEKLPKSIRGELQAIKYGDDDDDDSVSRALKLLNGGIGYYHFNRAVEALVDGQLFSCAFSRIFSLSPSFYTDGYCVMYLDNEVGMLNLENATIKMHQKIIGQELADQLRKENSKWQVVS